MTKEQEQMLKDVHEAVVGNPQLRQRGALERIELLEKRNERQIIRDAKITGFATAAAFGAHKFWDFIRALLWT